MTVSLTNTSGRCQVLVLAHETFCMALGECRCDLEQGRRARRIARSLTLASGVPSVGGGNVANLRAVDILEVKAVVEAAIPGVQVAAGVGGVLDIRTVATGAAASVPAHAATAAAFGLDTALHAEAAAGAANALRVEGKDAGAYGNRIEAEVRPATNGAPSAFDLLVVEDGAYREAFPNLSMTPDDARYVERIVNEARTGSVYVRVIQSATDIVSYVATTAALEGLSEFAAIYWPRVRVLNPAKSVFGSADQILVPPSGIVAGVYARTDAAHPGGVSDPPAGIEAGRMFGVLGFETDEVLDERKRDLVSRSRTTSSSWCSDVIPRRIRFRLGPRRLALRAGGPDAGTMTLSRFQVRLSCACGETTEFESTLARPGGLAPLPCKCGRRFVLQQLDEKMVTDLAVDPTGITGGEVPEDLDLPKVH